MQGDTFSFYEKKAILRGVLRHGVGKWAKIKATYPELLHDKTSVQIKDWYKTFCKEASSTTTTTTTTRSEEWTKVEKAAMRRGIYDFGAAGMWKKIHEAYKPFLASRSPGNIWDFHRATIQATRC